VCASNIAKTNFTPLSQLAYGKIEEKTRNSFKNFSSWAKLGDREHVEFSCLENAKHFC